MTVLPLRESQQVTLNGAGSGQIKLGPQSHRETWTNITVAVRTNTAVVTGVCQAQIFVGTDTSASNYRDQTFSGDTGDTSGAIEIDEIRLPNALFIVWSGGNANDVATTVVTGTKVLT